MSDSSCLETDGLNLATAVFLAEACLEAYGDFTNTPAWASARKLGSPQTFNAGNTQGFWAHNEKSALFSFRGTSNIGQWIRDLRILPALHPWGLIHRGFKTGITVIEPVIVAFIAAARGKHVWVTGHSLGGALAVLLAARLKMEGITCMTYTYGQPRTGYWNFADQFDVRLSGRLYRFINQADVVARVPPGLLFKHCGIPKRIVRPGVLEASGAVLPFASAMPDAAYRPGARPSSILESGETLPLPPLMVDGDVPGITEREFLELQLMLGAASDDYVEGQMLEGGIDPGALIGDHAITEYIRLLAAIRDAAPPSAPV